MTTMASSTSATNTSASSSALSEWDERTLSETSLKVAQEKLQSLCATHAATFVAVERRGSQLTHALESLLHSLDEALPLVSAAETSLSQERENGKGQGAKEKGEGNATSKSATSASLTSLTEAHKVRRRTLLQHSSLLELLELPPLLQACIRGQWYTEALDLCSLANTLERRHVDNAIVNQVVRELRHGQVELRKGLLGRWSGPVTLPDCLEVVTALRRLNAVELEEGRTTTTKNGANGGRRTTTAQELEVIHESREHQLQLQFLEARDVWLTSIKVETRKKGSEPLLDLIDIYRTRCFEIATQFITLFSTSTSSSTITSSSSLTTSTSSTHQAPLILSLWLTRRIHTFLHTHLSAHLVHITNAAQVRDVWDAATFFATSLGRIGGDFSPLLAQVVEPILIQIVTGHWRDGVQSFEHVLTVCREAGVVGPLYSANAATGTVFDNEEEEEKEQESNQDTTTMAVAATGIDSLSNKTPAPPRQLLTYPPLARLVNAFLMGLNELRRCLFPTTFPILRQAFANEFLPRIQGALEQFERAVLTPGFARQGEEYQRLRTLAVELKEEYEGCVRPYMTAALEVAFGAFENVKLLEEHDVDSIVDEKEGEEEEGQVGEVHVTEEHEYKIEEVEDADIKNVVTETNESEDLNQGVQESNTDEDTSSKTSIDEAEST